jgi:hypothetical protein
MPIGSACYDPAAMKTSLDARRFAAAALALLSAFAIVTAACKPAQKEGGVRKGGRTYTVRGQVTQLPDPASPGSGLSLSHEAIDDFVGRDGTIVGMDPMNMPFPVASGVSLAGISPADIVEFDLNVDWQNDLPVAITRIRKLPPGTELDFRAAAPDKAKANAS